MGRRAVGSADVRPPALPCRSLALTAALAADMMGAITYLEDVDPEGGSFFFWPRSHLAMHRYMCAHPERIVDGCSSDPWRRDDEGNLVGDSHNAWNTEILNDVCPGGYSEQPREWTAKAGDVVLW